MTKRPKTRGTRGTGNRAPRTEAQEAVLFKKGMPSANPGGKPKMPDWLYHAGPSALAMQVAAGTGRVVELDDDTVAELAARVQMASLAPATIRQAASAVIIDRVYGKVKESLEVEVQSVISKITRVVVRPGEVPMLEPETVTVEKQEN